MKTALSCLGWLSKAPSWRWVGHFSYARMGLEIVGAPFLELNVPGQVVLG